MTPKRRHADTGHIPSRSTYEPLMDSAFFQPPQRVRYGADREIDHEFVQEAIREWKRRTGKKRVPKKAMKMQEAEKEQNASGKWIVKVPAGFREVEIGEVEMEESDEQAD